MKQKNRYELALEKLKPEQRTIVFRLLYEPPEPLSKKQSEVLEEFLTFLRKQ